MNKETCSQGIKKTEPPALEGSAFSSLSSNIPKNTDEVNVNQGWRKIARLSKTVIETVEEPTIHFGWLVERGVNFIVAKAGEGKSHLCLSAAVRLARENPEMAVFYIDLDNPDWVAKTRGLTEVLKDDIDNLVYIVRNEVILKEVAKLFEETGIYEQFKREYENNKLTAWIHAIKSTVENEKVLIVFDSLQRFIDYNDYRQVADSFEVMEKLKSKGFTFLVIHHKNKTGEQKGLQLLNDNADQFIYIKDVKKNENNEIIEQTLELDKARAGNSSIVHIKYTDILTFTTFKDVEYTKDETLTLQVAISALKRQDKLNQTELVNIITSKISVGDKKVRRILNKFTGNLFDVEIGARGAKFYSLIPDSKVLKFFEEGKYTGTKKALLDYVIALIEVGEELATPIEFELAGKTIKYDSLNAIRNNILSMKHEEAEEVLEILSERYHDG